MCTYCNSSFTKQYPFTQAEHFQRSIHPGSPCSMPPDLLERLQRGSRNFTINIVGGSMTTGAGCVDGSRHQTTCAWGARMQDRLMQMFPKANLTVRNKVVPGRSYRNWLESARLAELSDADVLVVDLQVNSQVSWNTACSLATAWCLASDTLAELNCAHTQHGLHSIYQAGCQHAAAHMCVVVPMV
jgi:hypothetical protein